MGARRTHRREGDSGNRARTGEGRMSRCDSANGVGQAREASWADVHAAKFSRAVRVTIHDIPEDWPVLTIPEAVQLVCLQGGAVLGQRAAKGVLLGQGGEAVAKDQRPRAEGTVISGLSGARGIGDAISRFLVHRTASRGAKLTRSCSFGPRRRHTPTHAHTKDSARGA